MAYRTKEGKGPFPNKAGEYCGNHHPREKVFYDPYDPGEIHHKQYLATMRFGRPHSCKAGTTEEMEARGYVGLYLKEDHPLLEGEVEVPTPATLLEPN